MTTTAVARRFLLRVLQARAGTTVHVLWYGTALCGNIHGLPRDWPSSMRWIGANHPCWRRYATCSTCREQCELLQLRLDAEAKAWVDGLISKLEPWPPTQKT
jgi:hypothetical protein